MPPLTCKAPLLEPVLGALLFNTKLPHVIVFVLGVTVTPPFEVVFVTINPLLTSENKRLKGLLLVLPIIEGLIVD